MGRVTRISDPSSDASRALAEVEAWAWLLDSSIPVPGTGGRRIGVDALIGFVPIIGDLIGGGLGLFVVWRASRMGLPRVVVTRMLVNSTIDIAVGAIPFLGDAFDLWFKATTRNLGLMRNHLERPDRSTAGSWAYLMIIGTTLVLSVMALLWAIGSLIGGLFGSS